jgi:hypothetical protein
MPKVFLFGAGASCEYRGVHGPLFNDTTFFPVIREAWEKWMHSGEPLDLTPWNPDGPKVARDPHHYDGGLWRWPDLDTLLRRICGPEYETLGLERTFTAVAEEGEAATALYVRGIELTLFHRLRATDADAVDTHLRFLRQHLEPGDVILTFNYDPLLELALVALRAEGRIAWHPKDGYRIDLLDPSEGSDPPPRPSNVELLKLHGSMNWLAPWGMPPRPPFHLLRITPDSFRGPGRIIHRDEGGAILRPVIVPPRPEKDYQAIGLTALWDRADEALATSSALTVVGYRIPPTDHAALALLTRAATKLLANTPVTYVTRHDEDAVRRFQALFPDAEIHRDGFGAYALRSVST